MEVAEPPKRSVETLAYRSLKRSCDVFAADHDELLPEHEQSQRAKLEAKISSEYERVRHVPIPSSKKAKKDKSAAPDADLAISKTASKLVAKDKKESENSMQLAIRKQDSQSARGALVLRAPSMPKAKWHPQWKLFRVISGHLGWVRCITVDPSNQWFATGSGDRTIKIWDLASGTLKVSLTGHISSVRGLEVSARHPYLFSAGEDKTVKCWDLEQNKVIRHYHGHLSAVYDLTLHPTLDILFTCGRDSTIRVWDMRTKAQIHCLTGHTNTVASIQSQGVDPQVISGSHDTTIRMWDLAAGRSMCTLTNHKKSVRSVVIHPSEFTFASAGSDNIKQWYLPDGKFIQNVPGHNAVINSVVVNPDGVFVSGADNGSLAFFDYKTGYKFQEMETVPQPGSLDSESGIFAMAYDRSWSRLITAEADKTIKVYKEDPSSTEETHPVHWKKHTLLKKARF